MPRRHTIAASALGLATVVAATAAPAAAAPDAPARFPSVSEVADIYPAVTDGERRLLAGRGVEAPDPDDVEGGGRGCVTDETVATARAGRSARYRPAMSSTGYLFPRVQVRNFATPVRARAAYDTVRDRVEQCLGSYPTRVDSLSRRTFETPRLGQARIGYREIGDGTSTRVRIVVLKDSRLVLTDHERLGATSSDQLVRLTRLSLRTL